MVSSPSLLLRRTALAEMPAPAAADRVDSLLPPEGTALRPAVKRFDAVAAGESVLLRLHTFPVVAPENALLVVDRGAEIDLLDALPSIASGALGFACDRRLLDAQPAFWLQARGLSLELPQPALRSVR